MPPSLPHGIYLHLSAFSLRPPDPFVASSASLPELVLWMIVGLLLGSFANACIHRWPRELSVMRGRSHCPHCDHLIAGYDNIPVVSWILLLGRCRSCRGSISPRYPGIEFLVGGAFVAARLAFPSATAAAAAAFFWALCIAFWVDYDHRIIPDEISYTFTFLGLAVSWWVSLAGDDPFGATLLSFVMPDRAMDAAGFPALIRALAGAIAGGGILGLLRWVGEKIYHQEAMGLGDVKLLACIGAWMGVTGALYTLFAASVLGAAVSLVLMAGRRVGLRSAIAFGPFLALGAILVLSLERIYG